MSQRITGLETEYGCLIHPPAQVQEVLPRVRDWLFENDRYGLIDLHDRDWDEPAGNGGFLFNGGRVYIDMGHMEYCTPECATAIDVVRYAVRQRFAARAKLSPALICSRSQAVASSSAF